ncbi:MAG: long-chain fatty acid--CoA ligase [Solirubrobacteraceae bacterium]|nr:long-chain fatty acid--CoA ligase [Solirubrobacteraceae bacterium]
MTQTLGTGTTTIATLLPRAAELYGDRSATSVKQGDNWVQQSYNELLDESTAVGLGLIALGIQPGERVCIIGDTSRPWSVVDFGATRAGAIVVPIYQTNSPTECEWVISDSGAVAIFVENAAQAAKIAEIRDRVPALAHVIVWDGEAEGATPIAEFTAAGAGVDPAELTARAEAVKPEDPYTIIYTSGTTGPPKGCVLSHGNYRAIVDSSLESGIVEEGEDVEGEILYCFLPLAHSFARLMQLTAFDSGIVLAYFGGDTKAVIGEIQEVKPSILPSVPRIFEKIFTIALQMAGAETVAKATDVGLKVQALNAAGQPIPAELQAGYDELEGRLFGLVRGLFGGRLRRAITGAAPLGIDIISFFTACGVPLMQGYGMTETATATSCCTPEDNKLGSVGKPLPGVEAKLGDDGELLIRGKNVFQGYWHNDAATAETLTDGWLHTGDLAEIDADGFISIVGRKKDIIITAGGKNLTPANIEAELKLHPLVSQVVMHGDRRPYPVALVTLDPESAPQWAEQNGLPTDLAELSKQPKVIAEFQAALDAANAHYAQVEQIKKFTILPRDFSQETGELTPTLKVKRNVVEQMYATALDAMYEG